MTNDLLDSIAEFDFQDLDIIHATRVAILLNQVCNASLSALGRCLTRLRENSLSETTAIDDICDATGIDKAQLLRLSDIAKSIDSLPIAHRSYRYGFLPPELASMVAEISQTNPVAESKALTIALEEPNSLAQAHLIEMFDKFSYSVDSADAQNGDPVVLRENKVSSVMEPPRPSDNTSSPVKKSLASRKLSNLHKDNVPLSTNRPNRVVFAA